jgi:hypothetical protein
MPGNRSRYLDLNFIGENLQYRLVSLYIIT